jgi:putative endopeptidase
MYNNYFDYYNFINSKFIQQNPIPDHQTRWGTFDILRELNDKKAIQILNDIHQNNLDTIHQEFLTPNDRIQLKNMYHFHQCLKNNNDHKSFQSLLKIINQINQLFIDYQNQTFIEKVICLLNKYSIHTIFNLNLDFDPKNKKITILSLSEGGLYLPETDFYFEKNEKMVYIRKTYKAFIQKLFEYIIEISPNLFGDYDKYQLRQQVYFIEKNIAKCFDTIENRQNIDIYYNKLNLQTDLPQFNWHNISQDLDFDFIKEPFWITSPLFFSNLHSFISSSNNNLIAWKHYFIYSVIIDHLNLFQKDYLHLSNLYFQYIKRIKGQKKRKNITYRNYYITNNVYGFLIGKIYNHIYFNKQSLDKVNEMIYQIKIAFKNRLLHFNNWMSNKTKQRAIKKLENMKWKIAIVEETPQFPLYPDIQILNEDDIIDLMQRIDKWFYYYNLSKHNQPRILNEWYTYPHIVNAFYNSNNNEMTFPAGILQKPFFSTDYSDEKNYGGIGSVIGHELTHAFDTNGSKFDENGEYKDWWNDDDKQKFELKSKLIQKIYSSYSISNIPVNGVLTSGENIADIGGIRISLEALKNVKKQYNIHYFFRQYTICECNYRNKETELIQLKNDPHSPSIFRVNIVLNHLPEFLNYLIEQKLIDKKSKLYKDILNKVNINIEIW